MSSLVTGPERSVFGKITRSGLDTRRSRPPASMIVASDAGMPWSSTAPTPGTALSWRRRGEAPPAPGDRLAASVDPRRRAPSAVRYPVVEANRRRPPAPALAICLRGVRRQRREPEARHRAREPQATGAAEARLELLHPR